ncbi:MAG: SAVED domain-containing protein [Gammaproteobacteria bacterium]|nr:SAVED domain-containing protein [Gammaproteobacteria bacterium]
MVDAVTASWHGSNYQARVFWENALNLLNDNSCVVEVTFEANGPKSFDDVVVRYDPPVVRSGPDRINADYHQIKWHVETGGRFGYEDFVRPDFIGAQSVSLLQRLKNARTTVPTGEVAQFSFVTTYRVKDGDPLAVLISGNDQTLMLEKLFDGTGDRSRMGRIRRLWRDHLGANGDDELKAVLRGFRIIDGYRTLDELRNQINLKAQTFGITGVSADRSDFRYDELARQLKVRQINALTRDTLIQFCREEGLRVECPSPATTPVPIAIRSFLGPAADISDATPENTLLLTDEFRQRYLQEGCAWQRDIRPRVENFLRAAVRNTPRLRLILDAHASIAFLAGTVLNLKSAVEVHLIQKGRVGARVWRADDGTEVNTTRFSVSQHHIGSGNDIAVAISVAQPVESQVRQYVSKLLPSVGQLLAFTLPSGPGHQTVAGGGHAAALAEQVANVIRQTMQDDSDATAHIFAAVPNSLVFYLGQHHQSIAPCIIYEFDFDRGGNKTYQPSFVLD